MQAAFPSPVLFFLSSFVIEPLILSELYDFPKEKETIFPRLLCVFSCSLFQMQMMMENGILLGNNKMIQNFSIKHCHFIQDIEKGTL